jgi:hypothetical protein
VCVCPLRRSRNRVKLTKGSASLASVGHRDCLLKIFKDKENMAAHNVCSFLLNAVR